MEPVHGTHAASKIASEEDFISRMPEDVITNILNRLPIQNAVGTSILSRKWRFNWTLLTQLIFDDKFFDSLPIDEEEEEEDYDWRIIISTLLIHLKGPITKFFLHIPKESELDDEHINYWVMFLSGKGIKDFTLLYYPETLLTLPTHLFSCLELNHLTLLNCCFLSPPSICGFPKLLSLDLCEVTDIENHAEILTKCPLLEILKIRCYEPIEMKLVGIAKLKNLKELSLQLCMLGNVVITSSAIFQLISSLPKLQELTLDFPLCEFLGEAGVRKFVCSAFPCLKTLTLSRIDLSSMLSCAFEMIWGSPNLQTLKIMAAYNGVGDPPPPLCFPEVDNNTKLQLQSVDFSYFRGSENEVYFIKNLLACSPLLHNMTIYVPSLMCGGDSRKLMFASKLLELNRASPIAKVKLS